MSGDVENPRRLRIACVIHSLAGGGAERVMAGLSSRLAQRQHDVTLITFHDDREDRHHLDSAVNRVPLALSPYKYGLLAKFQRVWRRHKELADAIHQCRPNVVLAFCDRTNIDVLLALRKSKIPVIVCERSDPRKQQLGPLWNSLRRLTYRQATFVTALTESSANYLRSFCPAVQVITSAVDPPDQFSDRDVAASSKHIVAAGRLEHEKGFDRLVEAFATATTDHQDWRLTIFGDGSQYNALMQQAERLNLGNRFQLPGWARPLAAKLSDATFFCLPSRYEGFPSVLLETMAMGIPVLSVDCESGPRAIIEHGFNGLLVDPNTEGLTQGIIRLINHPDDRERLGRDARQVVNQFTWDSMVDSYEQLLLAACEKYF